MLCNSVRALQQPSVCSAGFSPNVPPLMAANGRCACLCINEGAVNLRFNRRGSRAGNYFWISNCADEEKENTGREAANPNHMDPSADSQSGSECQNELFKKHPNITGLSMQVKLFKLVLHVLLLFKLQIQIKWKIHSIVRLIIFYALLQSIMTYFNMWCKVTTCSQVLYISKPLRYLYFT